MSKKICKIFIFFMQKMRKTQKKIQYVVVETKYEIGILQKDLSQKPNVRERALQDGLCALSTRELIMLLLGSGTQKKDVRKLSGEVLEAVQSAKKGRLEERLAEIDGIGCGKALAVAAAIELGKRFSHEKGRKIASPEDAVPLIRHFAYERREHFAAILLAGDMTVLKICEIAVGSSSRVYVSPREVFVEAIAENAGAAIVCHNHPSNSAKPSRADIELTDRLLAAAEILEIRLLDHIIISKSDYFSFCESGMLLKADGAC